ncbi:unnamed protein product [Chrysodeixis includens]|uniref:Uncharacterized protein n=1 Tax=Chrysodeixis includens TaxID=689277 RepID=A0A9P0C0L2_CHRIL|nr:unnamed protein product [Chrysodeixis includens]
MLATSAVLVLASAAALLALSDANELCNTAIIGDYADEKVEEFTIEKVIPAGKDRIQINEPVCQGPFTNPAWLQITACDDDKFPQVYLRPMNGEVHRFGKRETNAPVTVKSSRGQSSLLRYVATMPINAETVNLAATYMILVILLFFLWLLYSTRRRAGGGRRLQRALSPLEPSVASRCQPAAAMPHHETTSLIATYLILVLLLASLWLLYSGMF